MLCGNALIRFVGADIASPDLESPSYRLEVLPAALMPGLEKPVMPGLKSPSCQGLKSPSCQGLTYGCPARCLLGRRTAFMLTFRYVCDDLDLREEQRRAPPPYRAVGNFKDFRPPGSEEQIEIWGVAGRVVWTGQQAEGCCVEGGWGGVLGGGGGVGGRGGGGGVGWGPGERWTLAEPPPPAGRAVRHPAGGGHGASPFAACAGTWMNHIRRDQPASQRAERAVVISAMVRRQGPRRLRSRRRPAGLRRGHAGPRHRPHRRQGDADRGRRHLRLRPRLL